MNNNQAKVIYDRINKLRNFIDSERQKNADRTLDLCIKNIDKMLNDMIDYNKCIYYVESRSLSKYFYINEDYIETIENFDLKRKEYHNKIIMDIRVIDLMCMKLHLEPIYGKLNNYLNNIEPLINSSDKDSLILREDIGNYAIQLVAFITLDKIENRV